MRAALEKARRHGGIRPTVTRGVVRPCRRPGQPTRCREADTWAHRLDEGTNHEAIAYAGATRLDGLTAIVVDNHSATHGWPGGIVETVTELLAEEPTAALVCADIATYLFTEQAQRRPDRVLNVGIREPLMVSVGGGLALTGLRPIICTYAPFLVERSFEQIKLDLTHQGVSAVLVSVGASYDWTEGGRTHQSLGDGAAGLIAGLDRACAGPSGQGAAAAADRGAPRRVDLPATVRPWSARPRLRNVRAT